MAVGERVSVDTRFHFGGVNCRLGRNRQTIAFK